MMEQPSEPPKRKKKKKITPAMLKKMKISCNNCKHYEKVPIDDTVEDDVFALICNAPIPGAPLGGMPAMGARRDSRWCGMPGKYFRPKGEKVSSKDGEKPESSEQTHHGQEGEINNNRVGEG